MMLKNKVATVFAGNRAIASEVCKELAKKGAEVFISGRNHQAIEALAAEFEADGGKAHAYEVDATDEQQIDRFYHTIAEARGSLDIVFNGTAKVAAFLVSDAGTALNSHIVDVDFGHTNVT